MREHLPTSHDHTTLAQRGIRSAAILLASVAVSAGNIDSAAAAENISGFPTATGENPQPDPDAGLPLPILEVFSITDKNEVRDDQGQPRVRASGRAAKSIRPRIVANPTQKQLKNLLEEQARKTVYLGGIGCSGYLLENLKGEPVGATTAEHCGLRPESARRVRTSLGSYIVRPPVVIQKGARMSKLKNVAEANTFIVPRVGDKKLDGATIVAKGHSAKEALSAERRTELTPAQIGWIQPGTLVLMDGWPVYQPGSGESSRQSMRMKVLERVMVRTTNGEEIEVLLTVVQKNKNGAFCSFGASGSEGHVMVVDKDGKVSFKSVGTLASFNDFTGKVWGTKAEGKQRLLGYQQRYGKELVPDASTGVCGFAYVNGKRDVVRRVSSALDIEGYTGPISEVDEVLYASEHFFDPNMPRTIVRGFINMTPFLVYGGEGEPQVWIKDPVVRYYPESGNTVLMWRDPTQPKRLRSVLVHNIAGLEVRSTSTPQVEQSTGAVRGNVESFKDAQGNTFAYREAYRVSKPDGRSYSLRFNSETGQLETVNGIEIGVGETMAQQVEQATQNFLSGAKPRQVIDGFVNIASGKTDGIWVKNPVFYYNEYTNTLLVAIYDSNAPNKLSIQYLGDLQDANIFAQADGHVGVRNSVGPATAGTSCFKDNAGNRMSCLASVDEPTGSDAYVLTVDPNGKFGLSNK